MKFAAYTNQKTNVDKEKNMDYFEYGDFSGLYDLFQSILALGALLVIVGIAAAIAVYLYAGYVLMCIGRKAGLRKENDWMAYVPVARDLYALRMAGRSWWCVFFFSGTGYACAGILSLLLALIRLGTVGAIISALFALFVLVVTLYVWANIYGGFGFNKLIVFCGFRPILDTLIAFSGRITFDGAASVLSKKAGAIIGTGGVYAGQEFPIEDGIGITIGRDPARCSLVYPDDSTSVSRRHCAIRYYADTNTYGITDFSKNGTFVNGSKLETGIEKEFSAGCVVTLGESSESFRLK